MLDSIETGLLLILPWSYVAKTAVVLVLWWTLQYRTITTTELGRRINDAFLKQWVMACINAGIMFAVQRGIDATEIHWPFISLLLLAAAVWPWVVARSYYREFASYRQMERRKRGAA